MMTVGKDRCDLHLVVRENVTVTTNRCFNQRFGNAAHLRDRSTMLSGSITEATPRRDSVINTHIDHVVLRVRYYVNRILLGRWENETREGTRGKAEKGGKTEHGDRTREYARLRLI